MKHKKFLSILYLALLLGLISSTNIDTEIHLISEINTVRSAVQTSPISIDGDTDFDSQAATYGWDLSGRDGSVGNPYLIDKPEITGSGFGIYILNTTRYFIIESGDLNGNTNTGIYLSLVSHGTISNTYINHTGTYGIHLHYCSDITLTKNTIEKYDRGIWVYNSDNIVIEDCTVSEATYGLYIYETNNVDVKDSNISNIQEEGIRIDGNNFNVSGNTITNVWDSDSEGIRVEKSNDSVIMGNTITDTANVGIYVNTLSHHNTINDNILNNTGQTGINLNPSAVTNNTVSGNSVSYTSSYGVRAGSMNNLTSNTIHHTFSAFLVYSNNTISYNTINHSTGSAITTNGNFNTIEKNVVDNSGLSGIYCGTSNTENVIRGNTIKNSIGTGLNFYNTGLITLEDNVLLSNTENLLWRGYKFDHFDYEISNNSFDGGELLFFKDQENFIVPASFWKLVIVNCSNFELSERIVNSGENTGALIAFSNDFMVSDNIFSNVKTGIELIGVENAKILRNQISNCFKTGIYSYNSSNTLFMENEIYSNSFDHPSEPTGIYLKIDKNSQVYANSIHDNEGWGLLSYACEEIIYEGNTVQNNSLGGIYSWFDDYNIFIYNSIETTDFYGLRLRNSLNASVFSNNISYCGFYGVYLESSENTSVSFNEFHNNVAHAFDNDVDNVFEYNYWDTHTSPDTTPADGIVDVLYSFVTNQDLHPLVNPYILTQPVLISPNGGETLNETISIVWTASTDSLSFSLSYSVFYSIDGGIFWTELASGLSGTTYDWDSKDFVNGTDYKLKVRAINSIGLYSEDSSDGIFTVLNVAHALTLPSFTFPTGGSEVSGIITIQWNPAVDLWHESMTVTYGIYVSSDAGITWSLLAGSLSVTSFLWDTETMVDGSDYLFKVIATSGDGLVRESIVPSVFTINNTGTSSSTTSTTPSTSGSTPGWTIIPLFFSMLIIYIIKKQRIST